MDEKQQSIINSVDREISITKHLEDFSVDAKRIKPPTTKPNQTQQSDQKK